MHYLDSFHMHTLDRLYGLLLNFFFFFFYFKPVFETGDVKNSVETEIIRDITPALKAYLLRIGMKKALCSLIGSVRCCNPST